MEPAGHGCGLYFYAERFSRSAEPAPPGRGFTLEIRGIKEGEAGKNYSHILTVVLFTPLVGALLLLFVPRDSENAHRVIGNLFRFPGADRFAAADVAVQPGAGRAALSVPRKPRMDSLDRRALHAGNRRHQPGVSVILYDVAWRDLHPFVRERHQTDSDREYYILFLLLQVGMLGVFMALDFSSSTCSGK